MPEDRKPQELLVIVKTDTSSDAANKALDNLLKAVVETAQRSNTNIRVLNKGAYMLPKRNSLALLSFLVSEAHRSSLGIRVLLINDWDQDVIT